MARASSKALRKTRKTGSLTSRGVDPSRQLLRHTVATLAYRAEKVLRDTPGGFAEFRAAPASRTPLEILSHLGDLMEWAEQLARGEYRWQPRPAPDWDTASKRFFRQLKALDRSLTSPPASRFPSEMIFQGPVADALTHVGQLSMLRGIAGAPVRLRAMRAPGYASAAWAGPSPRHGWSSTATPAGRGRRRLERKVWERSGQPPAAAPGAGEYQANRTDPQKLAD